MMCLQIRKLMMGISDSSAIRYRKSAESHAATPCSAATNLPSNQRNQPVKEVLLSPPCRCHRMIQASISLRKHPWSRRTKRTWRPPKLGAVQRCRSLGQLQRGSESMPGRGRNSFGLLAGQTISWAGAGVPKNDHLILVTCRKPVIWGYLQNTCSGTPLLGAAPVLLGQNMTQRPSMTYEAHRTKTVIVIGTLGGCFMAQLDRN